MRHFTDRGFRDSQGIATLGWYGEFPPLVQGYSGPGSPYWLSKGFLGLLLPADHPCWTAVEEPLPVERADQVRSLPAPGFVLSATRADGVVRLFNHGSDNRLLPGAAADPHYARLAYSTVTGPAHPEPGQQHADNHVGLLDSEWGLSQRHRIHRLRVVDRHAASWHRPRWPAAPDGQGPAGVADARIETASVVWGAYELRVHLVDAPPGLPLYESGWQVAGETLVPQPDGGDRSSAVTAAGLTSNFVALHGHGQVRLANDGTTSAFGAKAAFPYTTTERAERRTLHVALVGLTGQGAPAQVPDVRCRIDGTTVTARFPDGTRVLVALGPVPARSPQLGGRVLEGPVRYARLTPGERSVVVAR